MSKRKRISTLDKPAKRKKITVKLIDREHAGKVTEPYRLMEEIRAKDHGHLDGVNIAIAWRLGWRADANKILQLGSCRKRGDLDRELDEFDFVILLNQEAWPTLDDKQKAALIDHELCHAQVVNDIDGNAKYDDRDRLVCRIRKHDVEEFRQIVERHGCWTSDLSAIAQAVIKDAERPLLPADDQEAAKPESNQFWRNRAIGNIGFRATDGVKLLEAGISTLGELQDRMTEEGTWWNRAIKGIGVAAKERIENLFNAFVTDNATDPDKAA